MVALALSESLDLDGVSTDSSIANMFDISYIDDGTFLLHQPWSTWFLDFKGL